MKVDVNRRSIGVNFDNGLAKAVVWAPHSKQIHICFGNHQVALQKDDYGFWSQDINGLQENDTYTFLIDRQKELPDPASLSQPLGVHGSSAAIALKAFEWSDQQWENHSLSEYIIYELHTGTFTPEGKLESIEQKLDHLQSLGINAIEIMPLAQFPGERNWGYDGVYPFAVQHSYGGAKALQYLVNACHQKGIAVILDVVYNHLGPEGNYLGEYGPYITEKYKTPWGGAINFDDAWCDGVRHYFIENVLMWFRDFHIDALRLDAVHAIRDFSPKHILREIKEHVNELMESTGKKHYLIVELDLNDTRYIDPPEKGGYGMDAQWVDEFHHALRVSAGGEKVGYYSDFNGVDHLAKAFKDAYVYNGQFSNHRKKNFGASAFNEAHQFIVFSQNHDQVGNRMLGERTTELVSFEMRKLMAAAVILSPYLPMLFMGEEWSEPNPFLYFVSHTDPVLADAVRKGRKEEFAAFHEAHPGKGEAPDPMAMETFLRSRLQWQIINDEPHRTMLEYYRSLIELRKSQPVFSKPDRKQLHIESDEANKTISLQRWTNQQQAICFMNFSNRKQFITPPSDVKEWKLIFDSASHQWKGPQMAPPQISGGKPGNTMLELQPESIVIYMNAALRVN